MIGVIRARQDILRIGAIQSVAVAKRNLGKHRVTDLQIGHAFAELDNDACQIATWNNRRRGVPWGCWGHAAGRPARTSGSTSAGTAGAAASGAATPLATSPLDRVDGRGNDLDKYLALTGLQDGDAPVVENLRAAIADLHDRHLGFRHLGHV